MQRRIALFIATLALAAASVPVLRAASDKPAAVQQETIIDSDALDMQAGDATNTFKFSGNVHAIGQGIDLTCDRLDVIAGRSAKTKGTIGKMSSLESVIATGNVRIEQAGRIATAGKAEVKPAEGLVILSDNPVILDAKARVEGWKIIYNSKSRTVQVLPAPVTANQPGKRSRVVLSEQAIPKIDYEKVMSEGADRPADATKKPEGK
jgi:lipopolysaccharide transport protein LptA